MLGTVLLGTFAEKYCHTGSEVYECVSEQFAKWSHLPKSVNRNSDVITNVKTSCSELTGMQVG